MKEVTIDMQRIREALPKHALVILRKNKNETPYLDIYVRWPSLSEKDFEMCKDWQRQIIGSENISEFFTEETGNHWLVYLKKNVITFLNTTEVDTQTYLGIGINELIKTTLR
jgi:hypothetical protein